MKIYEEITVDITNPYPLPKMQAQQGNIGRGAKIKLVHNGSLIELDNEVINLYAKLPNTKDAVYLSTTIEGGIIKADFTNVMLSKTGEVQVELQIIEDDQTNGTEITTPIFTVVVNSSNIDTDNIIESTEYNALVDSLAELQYYRAHGLKGDKGDAATIEIGTVATVEAGEPATVTNAGTTTDAIFNFGIPKGPKGDKGDAGAIQKVNNTAPDSSGNVTITSVSEDAKNIATNTANIATNTANIATNTENISSIQSEMTIAIDSINSELYYKSGDTIEYLYGGDSKKAKMGFGYVTSSTKQCMLSIPIKKRISSDLTITCTSFKGQIRTTNGAYLDGSSSTDYQWASDDGTYTINANSTYGDDNCVIITISKSEAFTNVTNNTPVVIVVKELKITFS